MKVWLIWQVSCDGGHVCHVCRTEEKARERFEDVKQLILEEDEECYGVNNKFEEDLHMSEEDRETYKEMNRAHLEQRKRILNAMTFDDLTPGRETVNTKPYWEVWEVE